MIIIIITIVIICFLVSLESIGSWNYVNISAYSVYTYGSTIAFVTFPPPSPWPSPHEGDAGGWFTWDLSVEAEGCWWQFVGRWWFKLLGIDCHCHKVSRNVELQNGIPEAKVYAIYFWSQDSCFCSSMYKSIFKTRFLWEMDKTNNQLPLNIEYIRISTHQTSSPFNTWLALLVLFSGCKPGIWEARHPNTSWGLVVGPSKTYQTNTFVRHLDVEGKMCFQIPC